MSINFKTIIKINWLIIVFFLVLLPLISSHSLAHEPSSPSENIEFTVFVFDSVQNEPIRSAKVTLKKDGITGAYMFTNAAGKVNINNITSGKYFLNISFPEFNEFYDSVTIDKYHTSLTVFLKSTILEAVTQSVTVTAYHYSDIKTIQITNGNQIFDATTNHSSPTSGMTGIIQENVLGAAKAPSGEVHIRGQHGEFTYYLDDIPIPLGVFGSLNEIVDPKVIDKMTLITGGFPAEYGGQSAAVMDIQSIVPSGHLHIDFSTYAGSYLVFNGAKPFSPGNEVPAGFSSGAAGDTLGGRVGPLRAINSNGQSLSISNHIGKLGFFLSGSRQETDRRVDTPVPVLFNDHGTDYFVYGKFDFLLTNKDFFNVNLNYSETNNQVPFDIQAHGFSPDNQSSYNSFQTISYYHYISSEPNTPKNLFVGIFSRQGGMSFTPDALSPVNFKFAGDSNSYSLKEQRDFNTIGFRTKYEDKLTKGYKFSIGLNLSTTSGTENFSSRDSLNNPGPKVLTNFYGTDLGVFAQQEYQPYDWFRCDAGIRFDQHKAADIDIQYQFSPRIKLNFFPDEQNTVYLYYGRLFMPTNIEGLRMIASNIASSGQPTLPETDDFYEASYLHSFSNGFTVKTAAFYKYASPGIDDQTIGSSMIKTPVNIAEIRTTGIELGIAYSSPNIPVNGYINSSITHAYGSGAITGGFLPITSDGNATDLDHDQRLSIVARINYQPKDWFVNATAIYGSGLTNGNPDNREYQIGLFDFNSGTHVQPYVIANISCGYTFHLSGETVIEPSIYINNILDNNYILKGAYFSGANWGERRNVVLKLSVHAG